MSHKKSLTPKQSRAIEALLEKPTIQEAAESAGVNPRTIHRWLNDPEFRAGLNDAEGQAIDRTTRRLVALADKALRALEDVLDNPASDGAANKRLAASAILDQLQRIRELRNTEQRISALEQKVYGQQQN